MMVWRIAMNETVELRSVPERRALVVHAHTALSNVGATVGPIFGEVASWASAHSVPLTGPAVTRYSNVNRGECDLDAGFVVQGTPATEGGRIQAIALGGCKASVVTHMGSYETLHETYAAIETWMRANGFSTAGPMWEEYFSMPGTPPEKTRTDVYWPVREA
jgi:effector-binding domain-containing protein